MRLGSGSRLMPWLKCARTSDFVADCCLCTNSASAQIDSGLSVQTRSTLLSAFYHAFATAAGALSDKLFP